MVLHSLGCGRVGRRRHQTLCGWVLVVKLRTHPIFVFRPVPDEARFARGSAHRWLPGSTRADGGMGGSDAGRARLVVRGHPRRRRGTDHVGAGPQPRPRPGPACRRAVARGRAGPGRARRGAADGHGPAGPAVRAARQLDGAGRSPRHPSRPLAQADDRWRVADGPAAGVHADRRRGGSGRPTGRCRWRRRRDPDRRSGDRRAAHRVPGRAADTGSHRSRRGGRIRAAGARDRGRGCPAGRSGRRGAAGGPRGGRCGGRHRSRPARGHRHGQVRRPRAELRQRRRRGVRGRAGRHGDHEAGRPDDADRR